MTMNPSKKIKSLFTSRPKTHRPAARQAIKPDRRLFGYPEQLEMRLMPAIFVVTNTNDSGAGSFRQAILDSNANTTDATDTIQFDSSLTGQTITLASMVSVSDTGSKGLVISGPGAANLTLTGGNTTGLLQFSTSTTITDLKLGSASTDTIVLPGTNCLTLANIALAGSLNVSGSVSASCISVTGPITATGSGAVSITARNAYFTSGISTQSGNISVTADNGSFQSGSFVGIYLNGTSANLATTGGSITLKGRGGSGATQHMAGVCISQGTLYAGGTGCITIQGVSSNANVGYEEGVNISSSSSLTAANGSINITGTSCGSNTQDFGVYIIGSTISANGTGCLSISGTSGNGTSSQKGFRLASSTLMTSGGCITLSGTSCGTGAQNIGFDYFNSVIQVTSGTGGISMTGVSGNNPTSATDEAGIYMYNNYSPNKITTANGPINLIGQARGANSSNTGVVMYSTVILNAGGTGGINLLAQSANASASAFSFFGGQMNTNGGNVTISANSVTLTPTNSKINVTANGSVRFQTLGASINLGGADDNANLGLSAAEIGTITAGNLLIGRNESSVVIPNAGFETPQLSANQYQYNPSGGNWTFINNSGMVANGSGFSNANAVQGKQAAFVQMTGSVTQAISSIQNDGLYTLSYYHVGRPGGANPIQVSVGNANLGIYTPSSNANYTLVTTPVFTPQVTNPSITFTGQNTADRTSFIDSVSVTPINTPNLFISDSINLANISGLQLFSAGNISEIGSGNLVLASKSVTLSAIGNVTLNNATNRMSTLGGTAANFAFVNNGSLQLTSLTASGSLSMTTSGAVTQSGVVSVTGNTTISAFGYPITLSQNNTFQGQVSACGSTIQISNANSTSLNANSPSALSAYTGSSANITVSPTGNTTPTVQWQKQTAGFVSSDSLTQGSWKGVYGGAGSVIPNDVNNLPSYATYSLSGSSITSWTSSTSDVRALQKTANGSTDRIASCWYNNFNLNLTMSDGKMHAVTLYLLDWDSTTRGETIEVVDVASKTVISSRTFSGFNGGIYATWNLKGAVQFKITNTSGSNAVVSGLFIDDPKDDNTNWANISGATSATYTIASTATSDDGSRFRALITNSVGTFTTSSSKLSVTTAAGPSISTQPVSATVVSGATATFTAAASGNPTPTVQWQVSTDSGTSWNNISGATSGTYTITTANADDGKQFRAFFSNTFGNATSSVANLTVNYLSIATQPSSSTVNAGSIATFTAAATSNPAATVQWQVSTDNGTNWTNISGATSNSYSITTAFTDNAKQYRAAYTNSVGTVYTNNATLTVNYLTITTQPVGVTVNAGTATTFTAAASSNPTATVQWQVSTNSGSTWTNISGATSNSYTITTASTDNGNQYRAAYTNAFGTVNTNAATLTVNYLTITAEPVGVTVNSGSSATFTAAASSNPTATVQWQVSTDNGTNWTNISGATSNSYTITTATTDNGKQYKAVYTNSVGTVSTNAATLTVNYAPSITTNPASVTVGQGVSATFTAAASGNPSPSVQWRVSTDNGSTWNNISGATSTSYTFIPTTADNGKKYQAVFTNSVGSATTTAATLTATNLVTTVDVGSVEFRYDAGFQASGSTYSANGTVYLGYIPAQGNSFYKLLELNGNVSINTSTLLFSASGAVKAAVLSPSVTLVSGGITSGSVTDLVNGKIAGLAGSIVSVAGVNFTLDRIGFSTTGDSGKPMVQLQGSVALPGGLNLAVNGTNTVDIKTSGFSLTGACASLSNNFTLGAVSFGASNLTGAYTSANNTFIVTGQGTAAVTGLGNVTVNLGNSVVGSTGLVVTNGSLVSFDAAASINSSMAGANLTANGLKLNYNGSNSQFALNGNALLSFGSSNNMTLVLGNQSSPGVLVANGSLSSLNATGIISSSFAGASLTSNGLTVTYVSTPSQKFTMYGNASLNFGTGRNMNLVLGNAASPGMVVANGTLASLTAAASTAMTVGGGNFTANSLTLTYSALPNNFTVYGNAGLNFGSGRDLSLMLGNATSPGMVISSGSLTSLNASANTAMTLGGGSFTANGLTLT